MTRPGAGGIHPAALLVVVAAICYALYSISTRVLSRSDCDATTNFYSNLVGAAAITVAVPFYWTAAERSARDRADVLDGPVQRARALSC